ncbi:MAG: hypothetical protein COA43_15605 [Robiginitomaculum sp.]|nr:MAG: hypothetical protein COA43_15605 [Robiginitomaculum sp.]
MFLDLLKFELKLHTRQVGFWIVIAIMFGFGLLVMSTDIITMSASGGERIKANGAATIALQVSVLSMISIFFGAIFVVSGTMRDQVYKTLEIIHSTQVSTRNLMLSRMLGVYFATFLCLFAVVVGLFTGQFVPWVDKESLGPVHIVYFLQPTLVFLVVNTLFISGFYTIIAATTRNRALVYVSAVGLFIVYTMGGLLAGEDAPDMLTSLIDPFGANALALTAEFWPPAEQNTRMAPIGGLVGINRAFWGILGIVLYFAVFSLFKRGLLSGKTKKNRDEDDVQTGRIILSPASVQSGFSASFSVFWLRFKYEFLTTVKSVPFIILSLITLALFAMVVYSGAIIAERPPLPTSRQIGGMILGSLALPATIIIVFFSGEIIWRDKTAKITEILDASAVSNWPLMAAKWCALLAVVVALFVLAIVSGMIVQLALGDIPIIPSTYFKMAFIGMMPRLLFICLLVLFIQNFMPNRVAGMLGAGALVIFFFIIVPMLPFTHPLMSYGRMSAGSLSEMNGYSDLTDFKWFGAYWSALGVFFVVVSILLWRRGLQTSLGARLKSMGKNLNIPLVVTSVASLIAFASIGMHIYKAYNIDGNFQTRKERELLTVEWENTMGDLYKQSLPKIRTVDVDVNFSPSERTAVVTGKYTIENTTGKPLTDIYINMVAPAHRMRKPEYADSVEIDGAVHVTQGGNIKDVERFGYRIYRFNPALASGAITQMRFTSYMPAPSLSTSGRIERNGTFVNNTQIMPQIGVDDRRMRNPDKRRKYGLDEFEKLPDRTNLKAREINFLSGSADYVNFKAKMCTDIGQIAIAPGKMLREYEENGKACRDYETIQPIANFVSFLSADFTVKRDIWKNPNGDDVPLAIYHHDIHDYNVDLMIQAMKDSLDMYTTTFGPYRYAQLRIMEFPYGSFAQSFAGTIPYSERIGFVMETGDPDKVDDIDFATYVTMHEIGHQWFGHQIVPGVTKGFNVLSEGLTENAALLAYKKKFGWQKTLKLVERRSIQQYLMFRSTDKKAEPPLSKAEGQQYLDYNKSSWVFWGLQNYLGDDVLQSSIKGFLDEFGSKGPLYPTTIQLVEALRAGAPEKYQGLITDYWERITFWSLSIGTELSVVENSENSENSFTVTVNVKTDKLIADEKDGKETSVSKIDGENLSEWVDIAFYKEAPKKTHYGDWIMIKRIHITQADTTLTFDINTRPTHVMVDPKRLLIERNVKDNVREFSKKLASAKE